MTHSPKHTIEKIASKSPVFVNMVDGKSQRLYLELVENPGKIKDQCIGQEYQPESEQPVRNVSLYPTVHYGHTEPQQLSIVDQQQHMGESEILTPYGVSTSDNNNNNNINGGNNNSFISNKGYDPLQHGNDEDGDMFSLISATYPDHSKPLAMRPTTPARGHYSLNGGTPPNRVSPALRRKTTPSRNGVDPNKINNTELMFKDALFEMLKKDDVDADDSSTAATINTLTLTNINSPYRRRNSGPEPLVQPLPPSIKTLIPHLDMNSNTHSNQYQSGHSTGGSHHYNQRITTPPSNNILSESQHQQIPSHANLQSINFMSPPPLNKSCPSNHSNSNFNNINTNPNSNLNPLSSSSSQFNPSFLDTDLDFNLDFTSRSDRPVGPLRSDRLYGPLRSDNNNSNSDPQLNFGSDQLSPNEKKIPGPVLSGPILSDHQDLNESQRDDLKRELLFKIELYKKHNEDHNIPLLNFSDSLSTIEYHYRTCLKLSSVQSKADQYKTYLIGSFMVIEFLFGKFLKFDMEGFAQGQIAKITSYENLLFELGEKQYVPVESQWPIEVRLLILIFTNTVMFIFMKMISQKMGFDISNVFQKMGSPVNLNNTGPSVQSSMKSNTNKSSPSSPPKKTMKGPTINYDDLNL